MKVLPKTTPLEFVDVGGGLGITYRDEKTPSILAYCNLVKQIFGPQNQFPVPLKILLEPGRSISGNAGVLMSQVLYVKPRGSKRFLIIDAGMNDLMRPALYGSYHGIVPALRKKGQRNVKTDVVGPVCESSDCFATDRSLPSSLKEGDLLAILSAGAYGMSMANHYNTRPRPAEVLIRDGKAVLIRERETHLDLIQGERL